MNRFYLDVKTGPYYFFPVQQTTSGIGHRVNKVLQFFRFGNQYAKCEEQQFLLTVPIKVRLRVRWHKMIVCSNEE